MPMYNKSGIAAEASKHFQLMVLTPEEKEYMDRFVKGEYNQELLFSNPEILSQIENHPMALWKCNAK